jgi:peptidoglycan/xylan/chitin deacetylase (PgdA/CDA1 family)
MGFLINRPGIIPYRSTPVLLYHRITVTTPQEDPLRLSISPEVFDKQMQYLHKNRFTSFSLNELIEPNKKLENCKAKPIAITFDDGYLDNYSHAFPILLKYGFSAMIFLVTDYVGKMNVWDTSSPVPLMGWSQVKEMAGYGMSFQSHTRTHPNLLTLDDGAVTNELLGSRHQLEDTLGVPVRHIAYPYGRFDQRVNRLAGLAGYQAGWAAGLAAGGCFARERMQITSGDNQLLFAFKVSSWAGWVRKIRHFAI